MNEFPRELAVASSNAVTDFAKKYPGLMEALDTMGIASDRLLQEVAEMQQAAQRSGIPASPMTLVEMNACNEMAGMLTQFREQFYLKLVHTGVRCAMVREMMRASPPLAVANTPLPPTPIKKSH